MCEKFESTGLLYAHGELDESSVAAYESHLRECPDCAREIESYKNERDAFYTENILGATPSEKTSAEILRVCSKPARKSFFIPMMFLKKHAATPVFIMLIMVTIGGYIQYHSINANKTASTYTETQNVAGALLDDEGIIVVADSADSGVTHPRPQGDLSLPGVVTVGGE